MPKRRVVRAASGTPLPAPALVGLGALARAAGRGVRVRMVTDTDTLENTGEPPVQAALRTVRAAGIPVVGDNRQPIMHHKFTVVDGEWVQTGSWNYTDGDTYRLNNNL